MRKLSLLKGMIYSRQRRKSSYPDKKCSFHIYLDFLVWFFQVVNAFEKKPIIAIPWGQINASPQKVMYEWHVAEAHRDLHGFSNDKFLSELDQYQ